MPLTILEDVTLVQDIDSRLLGNIAEARAASEDGLNENHNYVDLRSIGFEELRDALDFEDQAFIRLEAANYEPRLVEEIEEEWLESYILPEIDFGIGSTVAAIAALGHVPISSCRGKTLGNSHRHDAPCVLFYISNASTDLLVRIATKVGISISNNLDMAEVYSGDIRLMRSFAHYVSNNCGPTNV